LASEEALDALPNLDAAASRTNKSALRLAPKKHRKIPMTSASTSLSRFSVPRAIADEDAVYSLICGWNALCLLEKVLHERGQREHAEPTFFRWIHQSDIWRKPVRSSKHAIADRRAPLSRRSIASRVAKWNQFPVWLSTTTACATISVDYKNDSAAVFVFPPPRLPERDGVICSNGPMPWPGK